MDKLEIPKGGAALLLAWQVKDKRVLIVGGGDVASGRISSVLAADAFITLISPEDGLHPTTKFYIDNSDRITYHNRTFEPDDLDEADMVLTAIDDVETSREICTMCRERKIPVNVADVPPNCDFYFGSQIRRGPLQILISTNGNGPKMANMVKTKIEQALPPNADKAIENVGKLRMKLRRKAPGVGGDLGRRRMQWMTSVCTKWSFDELAALDDSTMDRLLEEGWEKNSTPKLISKPQSASSSTSFSNNPALASTLGFAAGVAASAIFFMGLSRR